MAGSLPKPLTDKGMPTITEGRQAFDGDLRSSSALGLGDGVTEHTKKWLQVRSPLHPTCPHLCYVEVPIGVPIGVTCAPLPPVLQTLAHLSCAAL